MLGVDRLDMIKGIPQKLLAFEKFLEEHPEWRDKVLLVQIAVPSRTDVPEYQARPPARPPRAGLGAPGRAACRAACLHLRPAASPRHPSRTRARAARAMRVSSAGREARGARRAQRLRSMVHEIVGRINGHYGTLTHVPIHHLDRQVPPAPQPRPPHASACSCCPTGAAGTAASGCEQVCRALRRRS